MWANFKITIQKVRQTSDISSDIFYIGPFNILHRSIQYNEVYNSWILQSLTDATKVISVFNLRINPLRPELIPICYLLALL